MDRRKVRIKLKQVRNVLNLLIAICIVMMVGLVSYGDISKISVLPKFKVEAIFNNMFDKFKSAGNDLTNLINSDK